MSAFVNIISITVVSGLLLGCQSQPPIKYADSFSGCLTEKDIALLNDLAGKFERHIVLTYGKDVNKAYKRFLQDVGSMSLPKDFFEYSTFGADLTRLKGSDFYTKTWVRASTIPSVMEEEMIPIPLMDFEGENQAEEMEVYDPMVFSPEGVYLHCIQASNQNAVIIEYLDIVRSGIDISPHIMAKVLSENLSAKEYENGSIRLMIAINFHYQIGLMLLENSD